MAEPEAPYRYRLRPPTAKSTAVVGRRIVQGVLDLALSSVLPALSLLAFLLLAPLRHGASKGEILVTFLLLAVVPAVALHAWYWVARPARRRRGQTAAMALLGIRVVDAGGGPVGVAPLVTRWLLLPVDLVLVGLVAMLVDDRHRRIGDIVAGTAVVEDRVGRKTASP